METNTNLQQITLSFDKRAIDILSDEIRKKRTEGKATSLSDTFLIRLLEALNNKRTTQVFKIKDNKPKYEHR